MKEKYEVGVTQCRKCQTWGSIYTQNPYTYTYKCKTCKKNTKLKDKRKGGWRQKTKWLQTNTLSTATTITQILNKREHPQIQKIIQKTLKKPPHRRKTNLNKLIQNIELRPTYKTYKYKK